MCPVRQTEAGAQRGGAKRGTAKRGARSTEATREFCTIKRRLRPENVPIEGKSRSQTQSRKVEPSSAPSHRIDRRGRTRDSRQQPQRDERLDRVHFSSRERSRLAVVVGARSAQENVVLGAQGQAVSWSRQFATRERTNCTTPTLDSSIRLGSPARLARAQLPSLRRQPREIDLDSLFDRVFRAGTTLSLARFEQRLFISQFVFSDLYRSINAGSNAHAGARFRVRAACGRVFPCEET